MIRTLDKLKQHEEIRVKHEASPIGTILQFVLWLRGVMFDVTSGSAPNLSRNTLDIRTHVLCSSVLSAGVVVFAGVVREPALAVVGLVEQTVAGPVVVAVMGL